MWQSTTRRMSTPQRMRQRQVKYLTIYPMNTQIFLIVFLVCADQVPDSFLYLKCLDYFLSFTTGPDDDACVVKRQGNKLFFKLVITDIPDDLTENETTVVTKQMFIVTNSTTQVTCMNSVVTVTSALRPDLYLM